MKKADLIVAASETCADLWYAGGFHAPDEFIYFATPEERAIVVSALEIDRARVEARPDIRVYEFGEFVRPGARTPELLRAIGERFAITTWRIPAYFPVRLAELLRRDGCALNVVEGGFFPERQFKRPEEIGHIRRSLATAERAMRRAFEVIGASSVDAAGFLTWEGEVLTSERLRLEIDVKIVRDGGHGVGTIAASGSQAAQPHNTGSGPIRAGAPIVLDIFPRSQQNGYWGDLSRTVVKGKAAPVVRRAFDAVKSARDAAIARLAPGVDGRQLHMDTLEFFERCGFPTGVAATGERRGFFHGLGHGVGLEIHEAPRLNAVPAPLLAPGMVVTVEPGLYDPEWGGIRLEDLAAVTESGCDNLTRIETELEIP